MKQITTLDEQLDMFIDRIAEVNGFTTDDLKNSSRKPELVIVRQMCCYLSKKQFYSQKVTLQQIGNRINRHYATVLYSSREVEKMLEIKDKRMTALFNEVMEAFNLGKAA